jgi:hypothetical protein
MVRIALRKGLLAIGRGWQKREFLPIGKFQ